LAQDDDHPGAREAYAKVAPTSTRYVTAQSKLAWSYQTAGDKDKAVALAQQSAAAAPRDRDAQITYADLLRANERWAESAAALDRADHRRGRQARLAAALHARHRPGAGRSLERRRA
jgi:predicted TPR repeat methyltransferase